jgi:hypothetical protein
MMTMDTTALLTALRDLPSVLKLTPRLEAHSFSRLEGGIPQAALVELSGAAGGGKTELCLRFLSEHPELRVAWVEENLTIYPNAFPQNGVALERVLFVETERERVERAVSRLRSRSSERARGAERFASADALWTVHQMLRSRLFGVLVLTAPIAEEMALRRLQLAAEQARATVILLTESETLRRSWPFALQARVERQGGEAVVTVRKGRGVCA